MQKLIPSIVLITFIATLTLTYKAATDPKVTVQPCRIYETALECQHRVGDRWEVILEPQSRYFQAEFIN